MIWSRCTTRASLRLWALHFLLALVAGYCPIPLTGTFRGQAGIRADADIRANASLQGSLEVKIPPAPDPGPMVPVVVRPSRSGPHGPRVALVDVDGLLLNQNLTGLYSVGENPVAAFREKLEAAAADSRVRAVDLRINSPGGAVTACDIMAEELRRFRQEAGKPVVSCVMDLGTAGAYYLAVGGDRIVAHPTSLTGCLGAVVNHYNLQDAMAQLNVSADAVKAGPLVDMGSIAAPLPDPVGVLLQEMADGFRDRFRARVASRRPAMTPQKFRAVADGRVITASKALALHMIDRLGYVSDALDDAERLAGTTGAEVVIFQRPGYPTHLIYAITPNPPIQSEVIPFSYPGLDRAKVPTFLYLWQADPTLLRPGGR
jgi:protease-4